MNVFIKIKKRSNQLSSCCVVCKKEYDKIYRESNKDSLREKSKVKNKNWRQTPKGRYESYQHSAKQKNIEFNLSFVDFIDITRQRCCYCLGFSKDKECCGIDRVDN